MTSAQLTSADDDNMTTCDITISVVSHLQLELALGFIAQIRLYCELDPAILLTVNVPEVEADVPDGVTIIHNRLPKGFGANHNAAFARCATPYFCVANPDVTLHSDPFPRLVMALSDPDSAIAAPLVRAPNGDIEDSARRFPTATGLLRRIAGDRQPDYVIGDRLLHPDWVAGMFMLFRSDAFRSVGGFDERYHLYYEDVDICARIRRRGWNVVLDPSAEVVHAARRASHHNVRHAIWHAHSMARYLISSVSHMPRNDRLVS